MKFNSFNNYNTNSSYDYYLRNNQPYQQQFVTLNCYPCVSPPNQLKNIIQHLQKQINELNDSDSNNHKEILSEIDDIYYENL